MESEVLHFFKTRLDEQLTSVGAAEPILPRPAPPRRSSKLIPDVLLAINRIDDGSYGTCRNCGDDLPLHSLYDNPARQECCACGRH